MVDVWKRNAVDDDHDGMSPSRFPPEAGISEPALST